MLKQRLITAFILIPLVLALLFYSSNVVFLGVTALIVLAAAWEWSGLMMLRHPAARIFYVLLMTALMYEILYVPISLILPAAFLWWLIALVLVIIYPRGSAYWNNVVLKGLMGCFVLLSCWVSVNYIRSGGNNNDGIYLLFYVMVLIWGADTAAYFAGKKWGTTKLAPLVSPGKSVQGAAAAIIYAICLSAVSIVFMPSPIMVAAAVCLLAVITVVFSIVGDLLESMMKRQAGVKDSSHILPGHGGILDRIDSLTAAAPVFAFGIMMLGMLVK